MVLIWGPTALRLGSFRLRLGLCMHQQNLHLFIRISHVLKSFKISCTLCHIIRKSKEGGPNPTKLRRKLEPNFRHYFFAREGRIGGGGEIFDMKTSTTSMHCIKNEERIEVIQGSAKWWAPGCVNAAGKARQKWQARTGTKFTKPGARLLAVPCIAISDTP